jgi:hypothetical protein
MGVAIVGGTIVLVVTILQRSSSPVSAIASYILDEPAGTKIVGVAGMQDRLALQLQGGGPERVTVVDVKSGKTVARIGLAH